ncbi:MAG: hypothetical protein AB3N63_03250 [Puniceicoccaceae bacterium]
MLSLTSCKLADDPKDRLAPSDYLPDKWLNGINMPWIDFGKDFGVDSDSDKAIADALRKFSEAGVNSVRFWIHCDGRRNPEFDQPGGRVTGLPEGFLEDFETMLDVAEESGILVMPALWSFDMVKNRVHEEGPYAGVQEKLLLEDEYLETYIENALIPMLERCDAHPALFAWEICNEPEWMVEADDLTRIPLDRVQYFHARLAAAIHEHGSKPVTTGSSSIKWNSDVIEKAAGNWWSDAALQATYDHPGAYFDFYQIHVYGWMLEHGFDPYLYTPEDLGLDKPVMLGEAPGKLMEGTDTSGAPKQYTPKEMLEAAHEKGYFGHYFWSYAAHDGHGNWETIKKAVAEAELSD